MDARWWVVPLMFLLPSTVSAVATTSDSPSQMTDPPDDVRFHQEGASITSPPLDTHPHLDIRAAWIANETVEALEIGVVLMEWDDPLEETVISSRFIVAGFTFRNESFVAAYHPRFSTTMDCAPGNAVFGTSGNENLAPWYAIGCIEAAIEPGDATIHMTVPKGLVRGSGEVAPQAGDTLTDFFVHVWQQTGTGRAFDRAPDDGYGPAFFMTESGLTSVGDLILSTVQPVRSGNGESTSMVFPTRVTNTGAADDVVLISVDNPHSQWQVRAPSRIEVGAGEAVAFPVILSMEFSHEHGTTKMLTVRAESTTKPGDYAEAEMGVRWLEVPQPSGHHPFLWLHSAPADTSAVTFVHVPTEVTNFRNRWMNGVEDDPRPDATDEPVGGVHLPGTDYTVWSFPLQPSLELGLDLNLESIEPGFFETSLRTTLPSTQSSIVVTVDYCDPTATTPGPRSSACGTSNEPGSRVRLFFGEEDLGVLSANSARHVVVPLLPNATAEVIPHKPGGQLTLGVRLFHNVPQGSFYLYQNTPTALMSVRESLLNMPLDEYHDPIDQAFLRVGSLRLGPLGEHEKSVNPGRTAVFQYALTNTATSEQQVGLSIEGINAAWVSIPGPGEFALSAGERRNVTIAVEAPLGAQAGERAELFLVAENVDDPRSVALARLRAGVVSLEERDIPDEAGQIERAEDAGAASTMGLAAGIAALMAGMWFRRRGNDRR